MTIFNSILHVVSKKKIFEISANQFSRTTGWIGTILGRDVPCKVLIKCCYTPHNEVVGGYAGFTMSVSL
jgi:hypothetical protein